MAIYADKTYAETQLHLVASPCFLLLYIPVKLTPHSGEIDPPED